MDNKNFLVWLGVLSYLVCLSTSSSLGGVTMAFCKTSTSSRTSKQDFLWKQRMQEVMLQIPFRVDPVNCGAPLEEGGIGVSIRFNNGDKPKTVIRQKDQSEGKFITEIISKIIPGILSPIKSSLKKTLSGVKAAMVAYITEGTLGETTFLQLLVTVDIPKNIKIFKITDKAFFPSNMQKDIKQDIHIWIVTEGQQINHVPLPYSKPSRIFRYLKSITSRLELRCKVRYESDKIYSQYEGMLFHFFTVYHRTDQEEEVYRDIIDPLAEIFRPFFVFVSVNIDKYKLPSTVDPSTSMPFIVVTKSEQRTGIPIRSSDVPYTIEGLKTVLNAIVDPENDEDTANDNLLGDTSSEDVPIPSSMTSLTTATAKEFIGLHDTCLLGFYLPYTLASRLFLHHLITANEKLDSAGMPIALVNCANYPDICETFNINQFPTAKYRLNGGEWIEYKGILSAGKLVKLAQGQTMNGNEHEETTNELVEMNPSTLMKIFRSEGQLTSLGFLVADDVIPELNDALSGHNVYWLNSTRYPKLSTFLNGLTLPPNTVPPPVLVWVDYTKNLLYRLALELSPSPIEKEEINEFLVKSANGNIPPDKAVISSGWKPVSPPISFPSNHFLATFSMANNGEEIMQGQTDKEPLYADPNRYLLNEPPPALPSHKPGHNQPPPPNSNHFHHPPPHPDHHDSNEPPQDYTHFKPPPDHPPPHRNNDHINAKEHNHQEL